MRYLEKLCDIASSGGFSRDRHLAIFRLWGFSRTHSRGKQFLRQLGRRGIDSLLDELEGLSLEAALARLGQ
jgi:hypothetical protein